MASISQSTFVVGADGTWALHTAIGTLQSLGFTYTAESDWSGVAELGNKTKAALLGAFALYMKVRVACGGVGVDGQCQLTVSRDSSGVMGGALGVVKTNKKMAEIDQALLGAFGPVLVHHATL